MAVQITAEVNQVSMSLVLTRFKNLKSGKMKSQSANAINKVARTFRKQEKQDVKRRFAFKASLDTVLRRASPAKLSAEVEFRSEDRVTGRFKVKKNGKRTAAGVSILRGNMTYPTLNGNRGFVPARSPALALGSVFFRSGKSRHPISVTYGPSDRGMAHSPAFFDANTEEAHEALSRELRVILDKYL